MPPASDPTHARPDAAPAAHQAARPEAPADATGRRTSDAVVVVHRSGPLQGEVVVPGAKNSVLKLMAATLLADGTHTLRNVPDIADVGIMSDLLAAIGVTTTSPAPGELILQHSGDLVPVAPYDLVERIRASINVLGPLLGRFGQVRLSLPGGDDFGSRPIDMHLSGLEAMGATITLEHGDVVAFADRLHGADITFEFPSVGATENILTAAVHAKGTTVIDNAAREPEIADLCTMLVSMGAEIEGIGTSRLVVHGVEPGSLRATEHETVPDRIQAATYLAAAAVTGGELFLRGARADHMDMLLRRFVDMGLEIVPQHDGITVHAPERMRSIDVATLPYPGIATDYKPLIVTMLAVADGVGIVTENLYPGRFRYVEELCRLGADIRTDGHHAVVRGRPALSGAPVRAPDIRAGAALVIAGLVADGTTTISGVHHIDRGYDDLVGRLRSVGASIERRPAR
ncbi:MAG: UDP-N-acetylglucosamine 1-carboxyvinyltransferase [Actinobacteria bacterium]|jgi:UDP-N-acetylglucosamine 1-carboxyvinyltransferase|uniref:UDP-N-acetylglucosamine 1-carboxyvinyltransferase n=1 Tax=freshwater metagenome TaxID=449393 RepID=A0A6J6CHT2_9ZZZZ|nr:UDP-N-acetylglucosamine 1-carboxyvinyltransferase [Actinomycetota bacterium]